MPLKTIPAVSIIIPMYNAEKYIGECLDSILAQTFTDYEVIVVDDCSTDKSCDVVESYLPKFNKNDTDKLQLVRSKKNSSSPGVPRNMGIKLSRGEYIMFVDSDDAIVETALEELYPLSKAFEVDVLHCGKYYQAPNETVTTDKSLLTVDSLAIGTLSTEPILLPERLEERVKLFVERRINWTPFSNFVRRAFLIACNINFPNLRVAQDVPYTFRILCESKKFLVVPNVIYIYRYLSNSNCRATLPPDKRIYRRIQSVFRGIEYLDAYMSDIEFFVKRSDLRYAVLNFFKELQSYDVLPMYEQIPPFRIDPLIREELDKIKDKTALTAFLFARMNIFNVELLRQNSIIQKMNEHIQKQNQVIQQQQSRINELQGQLGTTL